LRNDLDNPEFSVEKGYLIPNEKPERKSDGASIPATYDEASMYRDVSQQNSGVGGTSVNVGQTVYSSDIAGTIAVAKGGTGATTALAGFNALSPLTTKGDILTHDGGNNVKVGVGNRDQTIVADTDETNGIKWSSNTWRPNPTRRALECFPMFSQSVDLTSHPVAGWSTMYGNRTNATASDGVFINYETTAFVGVFCGTEWNTGLPNTLGQTQNRIKAYFRIKTSAAIADMRLMVGLGSARLGLVSLPLFDACCFRYDTGADGTAFWRTVTNTAAGAGTVTTTGSAIAINTVYNLMIDYTGATPNFYINDVLAANHTTTLPAATAHLGLGCVAVSLTAAIIDFDIGYIYGSSD